jgi:hypothetical protein
MSDRTIVENHFGGGYAPQSLFSMNCLISVMGAFWATWAI